MPVLAMAAALPNNMYPTIKTRVLALVHACYVPLSDAAMNWDGPMKRRPRDLLCVAGGPFIAMSTSFSILANAQLRRTDSPSSFYNNKRQAKPWEGLTTS